MEKEKLFKYEVIIKDKIKKIKNRSTDTSVDTDGDESDEIQSALLMSMACDYNDRNFYTLKLLYEALDKIHKGEYGICEECGEDIFEKRLNAIPEVKLCIGCAEALEIKR